MTGTSFLVVVCAALFANAYAEFLGGCDDCTSAKQTLKNKVYFNGGSYDAYQVSLTILYMCMQLQIHNTCRLAAME